MEDVAKDTKARADIEQRGLQPQLSMQQISAILWEAYIQGQSVKIQRSTKNHLGHVMPFIFGKVRGYNGQNILISNEQLVLDDIHWCEIVSPH